MEMILTGLPGGSVALVLSGVMALVTIGMGRGLLREDTDSGTESSLS
jgi:hypothetical protein